MIFAKNLNYAIPFGESILDDVSFELEKGQFLGVLGHNGSGKTTLLDLIMGFRGKTKGELLVLGEDPHALSRMNKKEVIFLSQDVGIKGNISIGQFLRFQSLFYPNYSQEDEKELLIKFELDNEAKVGSLSLGQQKKLQIVFAFAARPRLILIDEITAVLDPKARELFFHELMLIREKYEVGIILATNIAEDLVNRADNVLFIWEKKAKIHTAKEILHLFQIKGAS